MNQLKQNNWIKLPLNTFVQNVIDYRGKTPPKSNDGIPLISAANIKKGIVILDGKFISQEVYEKWTTRGFIKSGDVLITTEAPVAEVAQVPNDRTYLISRRVMALQINKLKANENFVKYYFLYNDVKRKLQQLSHGTTVPRLYKEDILNLEVCYPPLPVQNKIASILSAYDDLIENNTRRIKILESMAQTLYQEWFVKFRFPGHKQVKMVESDLGLIPEGWEVEKLRKIADINKKNINKNNAPEQINYINITSVSPGRINGIETIYFDDAPSRARRLVEHGDIIWSTVRPNRKSYSLILNPIKDLVASTGFAVISAKETAYSYLYHVLTTDNFVYYLTNNATGSAYPAVNTNDFKNADIVLPEKNIVERFNNIVEDMLFEKENLQQKNINLRKTRDLLLPKLISGQIDVENLDIDTGEIAA